jgi:hypothetical protein
MSFERQLRVTFVHRQMRFKMRLPECGLTASSYLRCHSSSALAKDFTSVYLSRRYRRRGSR